MSGSRGDGKKQITMRIGPVDKNDENMATNQLMSNDSQHTTNTQSTQSPLFNPVLPHNDSNASPMMHDMYSPFNPTAQFPSSTTIPPPPHDAPQLYPGRVARKYRSLRTANPRALYPRHSNPSTTSSSSSGNPQPLRRPIYGLHSTSSAHHNRQSMSYGDTTTFQMNSNRTYNPLRPQSLSRGSSLVPNMSFPNIPGGPLGLSTMARNELTHCTSTPVNVELAMSQ